MKKIAVIALAALVTFAAPLLLTAEFAALAQTVTTTTTEQSPWQVLMAQVWAGLMPAIALLVTGLVTWLALWVKARFKIDVDAGLQQSLGNAIMSGILFGLQRIGYSRMADTAVLTEDQRKSVVATALDYTKVSVPDAVRDTKATDAKITQLANGKLEGIEAGLIVPNMPGAAPAPAAPAPPA